MKFLKVVQELQSKEENKERIIIVKCGAFFVSIGKDAIILNKLFNLKLTCVKQGICKVGIPINSMLKYIEQLEKTDISYAVFDYIKSKNEYIRKFAYEGKAINGKIICRKMAKKNVVFPTYYFTIYKYDKKFIKSIAKVTIFCTKFAMLFLYF